MANLHQPRGFKALRMKNGRRMVMDQKLYAVATGRSTGQEICPGCLVTLTGSAHADGTLLVDATTAADTANSSGKTIAGLVMKVYDNNGRGKDIQKIGVSETGRVHVLPLTDVILGCMEDGDGGVMTLTGSVKLLPGVLTNFDPAVADEDHPVPYRADLIDSSTRHATATQHALQIVGAAGMVKNRDTASARYVEVFINSTWL